MEIYGYDQNNGCLNSFFLIILSTFGAFYKITEIKLIKPILAIHVVQKMKGAPEAHFLNA